MDFKELYLKRRSTRAYTGEAIPAEDVRLILEAGLRAPNACNFQSWHFYCITDKAKIEALVPEVCGQTWIKKTSVVVVITEDTTRLVERWGNPRKADMFVAEDAGAAAENMLLMAAELGYAGCFVGAFDEDKCREFVGAKASERPVLILPMGVAEVEPALRDRVPFEDAVTFL